MGYELENDATAEKSMHTDLYVIYGVTLKYHSFIHSFIALSV